MQIMKLADTTHAGQRHLGEHRSGESSVRVRLESFSGAVHQVTPRPEGAAVGLGARPEHPVKGMAVGIS